MVFTSSAVAGRAWPDTQGASPGVHTVNGRASRNDISMMVTVPGTWRLSCSSGASW